MAFVPSLITYLLATSVLSQAWTIAPINSKTRTVITTSTTQLLAHKLKDEKYEESPSSSSRRAWMWRSGASALGFLATACSPQTAYAVVNPVANKDGQEEHNNNKDDDDKELFSAPRLGINAGFVSGGYATLASTFFLPDGEATAASIQSNADTLEEAAGDFLQQTNQLLEESSPVPATTTSSGLEECEMFVAATMAGGMDDCREESAATISGFKDLKDGGTFS